MGKWAGLVLIGLIFTAIARAFLGGKEQVRSQEPIMPAFGACADCDQMVPVTTKGRCSMCGSGSVVMPWSDGARLTLKEKIATDLAADRRRFRRGGQTA